MKEAVRIRDLGAARRAAGLWLASAGRPAAASVVGTLLAADRRDEALAFARGLRDPAERASTLLSLAQDLLDEAGAPAI